MTGRDDERDQQQPGSNPAEQAADRTLTSYAEAMDEDPTPGFTDWVMRSVGTEPLPRRGFLAGLALLLATPQTGRLAQAAVAVLILTVAVGTTYGIAQVGGLLPDGSQAPSVSPSPSPEPSPTPDASGTPSPSPTPDPSDDDDDASDSPDPSDDDDASDSPEPSDTPEPSETPDSSDSSGSD